MENNLRRFRRTAETFDDLALHQIVETEPACDGDHNSQNGYDSQQGTVCQRRRLVHKPVFGEAVDAEINGFDDII